MIPTVVRFAVLATMLLACIDFAIAQTPPPPAPQTPPPAQTPPASPPPTQAPPPAQTQPQTDPLILTVDEFRRELVGIPLCGTPATGPLAGKQLCTVHLPDGTAVVAGAGLVVRGVWEADAGKICRRNAHDPLDKQRCVTYERLSPERYRNSDGVEFCLGPCAN